MQRLLSLSCLLLAPALSAQETIDSDELRFAEEGLALSLTLPAGWTVKSAPVAAGRQWDFRLEEEGDLRLALRALPSSMVDGPEALRDTITAQASGEGYQDLTAFEAEVGGVTCPGISVEVHAAEPAVFARPRPFHRAVEERLGRGLVLREDR